jgi:hypothetical protein
MCVELPTVRRSGLRCAVIYLNRPRPGLAFHRFIRSSCGLWKNIGAAKEAHGPAFEEAIQSIFGSKT